MAEEEKTTLSRPVEPIVVPIIGTGDGRRMVTGTEAVTPDQHTPNLVTQVVSPLLAIAIRFGNDFCVSFSGALLAGGITTKVLPHSDSEALIWGALILSCSIAGVGAVKNFATVFSGLEKKFPLASGSV